MTLTGTGFQAGATVTIGGAAATAISVVSATQLTATTPAGTAGPKDVVVTTPDGQSTTLFGSFTYIQVVSPGPSIQGRNLLSVLGLAPWWRRTSMAMAAPISSRPISAPTM